MNNNCLDKNRLSDLPEFCEYENETLATGETIRHRILPKFVGHPGGVGPNDIAAFTDAEGSWFVVYGYEGGPHKRRA